MNTLLVGLIIFTLLFGCGMLGMRLRTRLPNHHLDAESKDVLRLVTGIIATLSAMVLGLLISTTKIAFDRLNVDLKNSSGQILQLDRALAQFGPETADIRQLLKQTYSGTVDMLLSGDERALEKLQSREKQAQLETLIARIYSLSPRNEAQRAQQAQALSLFSQLADTRFENVVQIGGTIPTPFFAVLLFWMAMLMLGFGLFSPKHLTATAGLLVCALCLSGALVVLIELDRPLSGLIRLNPVPMRNAISHLGE
jgi:hypothetical protein